MIRSRSKVRSVLVAALVALSVAPVANLAMASDVADEADLQFELGAERYKSGDFLGALEHFLASNRLAPNRNVVFNIARCYEQLKRFPDAHRAYSQALEGEADPAKKKAIEEALARIASKVAVLDVRSDPPGATIYLDRVDLGARGQTPRTLGLAPGTYKVLVELPGYESITSKELQIAAGTTTNVTLKLVPILAKVTISGEAQGAAVRIDRDDGAAECIVPCTVSLAPGHHTLFLSREGYQPSEVGVDLTPKQVVELKPKMSVYTGNVVVNADVRDALIEIDGAPMGFSPAVLQVPVGKHTMRISLAGYRAIEREVDVRRNEQTKVEVQLTEAAEVTAASRSTESVETAPASVTIIPKTELVGMAYPTIAEALRGTRGIYVTDDRSYVSLGFRGFSRVGDYGNRVLVLVDGQPTNDDYIGSSYVGFDGRVDLDDVERIEVVRGPGSVLYGTGAFFGVVNLVTRSRLSPTHVEAGVSTVDYGVARARVHATYRFGEDSGVWTSVSGARSPGGRDFQFSEFADTNGGNAVGVDGFNAGTVSGRFWWKDFSIQWFYTRRLKHLPTGVYGTAFNDLSTKFVDTRSFLEATYQPTIGKAQLLTRAHVNTYDFRDYLPYSSDAGGAEVDTFTGRWAGLEQRVDYAPSSLVRFTVGGEAQRHFKAEQIGQNDVGYILQPRSDPYWVGGGYVLVDVTPTERVKVSPGVRVDYISTVGASVNPRLAVIVQPWRDGVIKLLGGKAFRAPSVYELYYRADTQLPSVDLKPENIYSSEVELTQRLSTAVSATVSGYLNYVQNLVILDCVRADSATDPCGTTTNPNIYRNSNRPVETLGAEAELRRDFRQGWMVAAQLSLQHTHYLKNDDGALRAVPNSPDVLAAVKGAVPIMGRSLSAWTRLTFAGPRWDRNEHANDPPQGRTDVALLWDFVLGGESERGTVHYAVGVYNLFDWRWAAPISREYRQTSMLQAGRTVYASTSVSF